MVEFPWGHASDPRGGSPRALGGVFDSFEGFFAFPDALDFPLLQKLLTTEEGFGASIGWFRIGVGTYSRWSKRHLPQVELLSGDPSENLCPI